MRSTHRSTDAPLMPVVEGIWTAPRPQRFWGLETGTRMTVVRLSEGGLFVHCPVALDEATREAVDRLGDVRAVVSSSLFHPLYAGNWMKAYPKAVFFACPGLEKKRSDLAWSGVLSGDPHPVWAGDLDQGDFTARFEHEIVFFHRPTRTLITADALLNLRRHPSRVTRAVAIAMANTAPGKGWMERFAVRDRAAGRRQVDRILEWDIDRILLAHGDCVERDGRRVVREAYAWL
jgi:hypothetical protein